MYRRVYATIIITLAMCFGVGYRGFADVVSLNNGSIIYGQLIKFADGRYTVKTEFAGPLQIDGAAISAIATDGMLHLSLKSGNAVLGKLLINGDQRRVVTQLGDLDISDDEILAIWLTGEKNPLIPEPPKPSRWAYQLGLDTSGKTGNSEKFLFGGTAKATLAIDKGRLLMYARGKRSRENGVNTDKELIGGIDYEGALKTHSSWYARIELEDDEIEGLDLRTTAAAGYGYYFLKTPDHQLRGRSGLQFRHESFEDGTSNRAPGLDFGFHHQLKSVKTGIFTTDINYTPSFEDFTDYRIYHESSIALPLAKSNQWKLTMGISNEYNSQPARGLDSLDTTYFSRFVFSWE